MQRLVSAAIARVGGREPGRIGLEKIEALVSGLREAAREGKRFSANVGGARLRTDGKGVVSVERENPRRQPSRSVEGA
jgi:hypothetical protein